MRQKSVPTDLLCNKQAYITIVSGLWLADTAMGGLNLPLLVVVVGHNLTHLLPIGHTGEPE